MEAPDLTGPISRIETVELREAVSARISSKTGNDQRDLVRAYADAYRAQILPEYQTLAALRGAQGAPRLSLTGVACFSEEHY